MPSVIVRLQSSREDYQIKIGANLMAVLGAEARACLGASAQRAALISNPTVFTLYGEEAMRSLRAADFAVYHWLMKDGERHKSLRSFERALAFLSQSRLERNDCVVALGGGVVGDLAGFAAATHMRGIPFIQVPTTLLAQIDASVGGKTGVNTAAGKNLVGAFHQPRLVMIDTNTLRTLPQREITAGWCEAVKQGAIGDRRLFDKTFGFLHNRGTDFNLRSEASASQELSAIIAAQCSFKAAIVSGDERESPVRQDRRSRRILNFGHTTAHAIEKVTRFGRFRHGEAVGWGMLVAGEISKNLGMLGAHELESLRDAVRSCGSLPRAHDLDVGQLIRAMKTDKKSVAGRLQWVLLEKIGKARIVNGADIDPLILRQSLRTGLRPLK